MLTKNVQFAERPENVMICRVGNGFTCRIDFPVNIREVEMGEENEVQYLADVYSVNANYTEGMQERVENEFDFWFAKANEIEIPQPTIQDAIDAINALTEIVLGGE